MTGVNFYLMSVGMVITGRGFIQTLVRVLITLVLVRRMSVRIVWLCVLLSMTVQGMKKVCTQVGLLGV